MKTSNSNIVTHTQTTVCGILHHLHDHCRRMGSSTIGKDTDIIRWTALDSHESTPTVADCANVEAPIPSVDAAEDMFAHTAAGYSMFPFLLSSQSRRQCILTIIFIVIHKNIHKKWPIDPVLSSAVFVVDGRC